MFERFTVAARDAVMGAVEVAGEVHAPQVDTGHLLVALARDPGPTGEALRETGVTAERLLPDLAAPGTPAGFDPAALSALGIDYDEVRRAVDEEFGAGALDRALGEGRSRRRGHVPFAPEGKRRWSGRCGRRWHCGTGTSAPSTCCSGCSPTRPSSPYACWRVMASTCRPCAALCSTPGPAGRADPPGDTRSSASYRAATGDRRE